METQKKTKSTATKKTKKVKLAPLAHGVGRRKASIARVWLRRGSGKIIVNDREYASYFDIDINRQAVYKPMGLTPVSANYDVEAFVEGGGRTGQAGAVQLGISRALVSINETLRPIFRKEGLLTVDPRVKERKKYGQKAARRRFQFVKR